MKADNFYSTRAIGKNLCTIFILVIVLAGNFLFAQDKRAQYPKVLSNSYFDVNIGFIDYSFSKKQLEPGFSAASIRIPHTAVRIIFGHEFNKYLSVQLSYMRPIAFVEYRNVNGSSKDYEVGMNVAGITGKAEFPISKKISMTADAGVSVVTRGGFIVINQPGVKDAGYTSLLVGAGFNYHLNNNWALEINGSFCPANEKVNQPATIFCGAGFKYAMRTLSQEKVDRNTGLIFQKHIIQINLTTNALGYGVNNFVSKDAHVFWGGAVQVRKGFSLNYEQNIFHTRKLFSFDLGAGIGYWESKINRQGFFTLSMHPLFRFTFARSKQADFYLNYSFGGPAFISKTLIDEKDTGRHFTFQDFMGLGVFTGNKKQLAAEIRIAHYSNGNIFPQNNGVMIPLTFVIGYSPN